MSWRRTWQPTPVFLPGEFHWTEELGGLQSIGSQRVKHDRSNFTHSMKVIPSDLAYGTSMQSESESRSVVSDSLRPHGLHSSWNSLGQNTGVGGQNTGAGSHSLLQGIFPIQGGFFTSWAIREALKYELKHAAKHQKKKNKKKTHWVSSQSWDRSQGKKFVGVCGLRKSLVLILELGLPWWLSAKEPTCQCRRHEFNLRVRKIPWKRKWQPNPVFLPRKYHVQRNLAGCSSWGHKGVRYDLVTKQF